MDNKTILVCSLTQGEKAMSKLSAFVLVATVATAASALPALARSFDPKVGTGNIAPLNAAPAPQVHHRAAIRQTGRTMVAAREAGLHAFAMIPGAPGGRVATSTHDPAIIGGGSLGYGQNLANY
jgi:hypothetical protein